MDETAVTDRKHNDPPEPIDAEFESLSARVDTLAETANKWANERPEITSEDMAATFADFLSQAKAEKRAVEKRRKDTLAPHRTVVEAINTRFGALKTKLETIIAVLSPRMTAWGAKLEAERQARLRREEEAAARLRRDAEVAAAKAEESTGDVIGNQIAAKEAGDALETAERRAERTAKTPVKIKGTMGARAMSMRTRWLGRIVNQDQIYHRYRDNPALIAELQRVLNEDIRGDHQDGKRRIAGAELYPEHKTV